MSEFKKMDDVDSKFDRAEKVWDRFQKLLLKIVGGVVAITLTIYIAYGQLKDTHEEYLEKGKIERVEELKNYKDTTIEHSLPYNNTINYRHIQKEEYMVLSRLQSDCEYYLGSGNRNDSILFNSNVREHIQYMKEVWIGLEKKPEWLTMKDIIKYERKMKEVVIFTPDIDSETDIDTNSNININATDVVSVDGVYVKLKEDSDVNVQEYINTKPKYYITKKTWDIDSTGVRKGDTIYIDYYSDGYIEKYYTDGTSYPTK